MNKNFMSNNWILLKISSKKSSIKN